MTIGWLESYIAAGSAIFIGWWNSSEPLLQSKWPTYNLNENFEKSSLYTCTYSDVFTICRTYRVCGWVCLRGKLRTYNKKEQWVHTWRLLLANVLDWKTYKSNGTWLKSLSPTTNVKPLIQIVRFGRTLVLMVIHRYQCQVYNTMRSR